MKEKNIFSRILSRPKLVYLFCALSLIISTILLLIDEITTIDKEKIGFLFILGVSFLLISITIVTISIIHSIILKKWRQLLLSVFVYFGIFIIYFFVNLILAFMVPTPPFVANNDFYVQKFEYHTSLNISKDLKIICKTDTIKSLGPGGGDYSAGCIFSIDKNQVNFIKKKLESDTIYKSGTFSDQSITKHSLDKYLLNDIKGLKCSKNIIYNESYYKSERGSGMFTYIFFSNDNKYMLFCIDYF